MKKSPICILLLFSIACSDKVDISAEKKTILSINEEQRTAHMTNNAQLLVKSIADTLVTIDSGEIYINSNQQVLNQFSNYFSGVKYLEWDDLMEPIIDISADGSLATMSVKKGTITAGQNEERDTTQFAWTSVFKKIEKEWKMVSITSTDNH